MSVTRVALAALLILSPCALAPTAAAQTPVAEPDTPTLPTRLEIGGTAGLAIAFPEFGLIASVPLGPDAAIEVAASRLPAVWDAPAHVLGQVQVRLPFRTSLRSRKSVVLGLTSISAIRSDESFFGVDSDAYVRPHAGVSLQWPIAPTLDFRFDALGVFTFERELPLFPRAMTALVWHQPTSRANKRRTSR